MTRAGKTSEGNRGVGDIGLFGASRRKNDPLAQALALLGLTSLPADEAAVRAAFVAHMKHLGGAQGIAEGDYDMDAMTKAKELLLVAVNQPRNEATESACKMCAGSGRIGTGFGRVCPSCKGTGHT